MNLWLQTPKFKVSFFASGFAIATCLMRNAYCPDWRLENILAMSHVPCPSSRLTGTGVMIDVY